MDSNAVFDISIVLIAIKQDFSTIFEETDQYKGDGLSKTGLIKNDSGENKDRKKFKMREEEVI